MVPKSVHGPTSTLVLTVDGEGINLIPPSLVLVKRHLRSSLVTSFAKTCDKDHLYGRVTQMVNAAPWTLSLAHAKNRARHFGRRRLGEWCNIIFNTTIPMETRMANSSRGCYSTMVRHLATAMTPTFNKVMVGVSGVG